jgi:hypothetical protein
MTTMAEPDTGVAGRPTLPSGLLIANVLVIGQSLARAYFLFQAISSLGTRLLDNTQLLLVVAVVPVLLLVLNVIMIALIFARSPGGKPYGITVSILNIVWLLYGLYSIVTRISQVGNATAVTVPLAINLASTAVFVLAIVFLARWAVVARVPVADVMSGASHRGTARASLICALCGPLMLVILGPTALILGIVARSNMRASNNFDGKGMALAGIIIGSIESVIAVLALLVAVSMRF